MSLVVFYILLIFLLFDCWIIVSLEINIYNEHLPFKALLITSLVFLLLTLRDLSFHAIIEGLVAQTWVCTFLWNKESDGAHLMGPGILHFQEGPSRHWCCWSPECSVNSKVLGPLGCLSFRCCHFLRESWSQIIKQLALGDCPIVVLLEQDNYLANALGLLPPCAPVFLHGAGCVSFLLLVVVVGSSSPSEFRCGDEGDTSLRLVRHLLSELFT